MATYVTQCACGFRVESNFPNPSLPFDHSWRECSEKSLSRNIVFAEIRGRLDYLEAMVPCSECREVGTHLGTCSRSMMHGGTPWPGEPDPGPLT